MTRAAWRRGRRPRGRDAGLTLVELLVTIIVASMVASSTFVFFAGQQRIYETQTKLLNVQQNLWMALEVMSRQMRAAGAGMSTCVDGAVVAPFVPPLPPTGTAMRQPGIRAWRQGTGATFIRPLQIQNGAAGAPDSVTFAYFTNASGNFWDGQTTAVAIPTTYAGTPIPIAGTVAPYRVGEFILLVNIVPTTVNRDCSLFQITGLVGTTLVVGPAPAPGSIWNAGMNVPGPPSLIPAAGYPASSGIRNVGSLNFLRYFILTSADPNVAPRLMVDDTPTDAAGAQVLAEGIEDLQIAYACDLLPVGPPAGDGALTEGATAAARVNDEWTYNQAGDAVPAGCGQPSAIRITLIGRSLTPDQNLFGSSGSGSTSISFKPAVEDGVAGAPDLFRHRTLTTTIYSRN